MDPLDNDHPFKIRLGIKQDMSFLHVVTCKASMDTVHT